MYIKRSIKFSLYKKSDSSTQPIRMRISFNDDRIDILTGYRIESTFWIKEKEKVKDGFFSKNGYDSHSINSQLNEYRVIINDIFNKFELIEKRIPTKEEIKTLFLKQIGKIKDESTNTFFDIYDEFVRTESLKNNWSESTLKKFKTIKKRLLDFDKKFSLNTLNDKKLENYIEYLNSKKYNNSTIEKEFRFLKWILRWCFRKGYYKGNLHEEFNPKFKKIEDQEVIFLTYSEIKKLQEKEFKEKHLERVRDIFLFCCFTGLRYSDVEKLKHSNIKSNHIVVTTQKTSKTIKIELNKFSKEILEKYKNNSNEYALPVISNQKMNYNLKIIGKECEINEKITIISYKGSERVEETFEKWELLTTHCGRRSFVTNALYLNIPTKVIMKWTGHTAEAAMKPYEKIVDELKQREMSKFDNLDKY